MSHELIQSKVYLEDDNEALFHLSASKMREKELIEWSKTSESFALLIPNIIGSWKKGLIECAVNLLVEIVIALRPNPVWEEGHLVQDKTQDGIHERMMVQLKQVASTLGYMINSTSWQEGTYHDFDIIEIKQRLTTASKM